MRLVFILYAEDRDLLPSRTDERARELYESGYSVRSLFGRLIEDFALNPDTMDERRGAWGRLLALFRLIHKGHRTHFVQARGGKLFDPDAFPFLEGRDALAKLSRVACDPDAHPPCIGANVVHAIRYDLAEFLVLEVVHLHALWIAFRAIVGATVLVRLLKLSG
jgi:hypothetical protein